MKIFRLFVACSLPCFALVPGTQAVVPPPGGCYSNFTTAEGCQALNSLAGGVANTGVGWRSLFLTSTANFNTAIGAGALVLNNADSNTAVGAAALLLNTSGESNVAVGTGALVVNDSGNANTASGAFALYNNTSGNGNTAMGTDALITNTIGSANTAIGDGALFSNATGTGNTALGAGALFFYTGNGNTAIGRAALFNNTTSTGNTAVGFEALLDNDGGDFNTATGSMALHANNGGDNNTAMGYQALEQNTEGFANTAVGRGVLASNVTGSSNTAMGYAALSDNVEGTGNVAIGYWALRDSTGTNNIAIGLSAGRDLTNGDANIYIGSGVTGVAGETAHTYIRNINNTSVSGGGTDTVTVNLSTGLLGHLSSSRRHKEQIQPMANSSEALYRLKPVSYRYKKEIDSSQALDYGLVAEEVAEIDPNLTACNRDGQIESVRYNAINAMLLNEFLKEHRKNEEQGATIARLEKQLEMVTATLQKVSAQLELRENAPQTALNNQ